ncbi:hypothetical protein ACIBCM_30860 [Streptomyces sp. NPDC051018]|uniref:hypothetical protein n=1 Tax=Streptomyces sp. NPDC051018 TaxID=3365639 RepID=UPI003796839D
MARPVKIVDEEGFRFTVTGSGAGTTPQEAEGVSARPGYTFAFAEFMITNEQTDRTAPLHDLSRNWYVQVPRGAFGRDYGRHWSCGVAQSDYCGGRARCEKARLGEFEVEPGVLRPAESQRYRCMLSEEVRMKLDPQDIRLVRWISSEERGTRVLIPLK